DKYHPDSIRYFILANGPEKRDADFTWREFINSHNGELLGAWGNFVNRTLAFIYKYFNAAVPEGGLNPEINAKITEMYRIIGTLIEKGSIKEALDTAFESVRFGNKYFDAEKPWDTRKTNTAHCSDAIYTCVQMIANLAVMLEPFLPFSSAKIRNWLSLDNSWSVKFIPAGFIIPEPEILFERLDKKAVDEQNSEQTN
ncbi:MAG: class I tRNA ligase family protein, partial [Oscillospiraceae bacterium]|nr:class I tRNA ligase family protein [Oscillospiraceae bacterium]